MYTVEQIEHRINKEVIEISELTGLSHDESILLLRHFHWSKDKINQKWFSDSDKLMEEIGLKAVKELK